jgi:hypothetical protein
MSRPWQSWESLYLLTNDGCHIWTGAKSSEGYGRISRTHNGTHYNYAHVFAWVMVNGPIPIGMMLYHGVYCGNRLCVNPEHLVLTDAKGNAATRIRNSFCGNGHDMNDPSNLYIKKKQGGYFQRVCKACALDYHRNRKRALLRATA